MAHTNQKSKSLITMILGVLALNAGCASTPSGSVSPVDPYESFNRPVHGFNTKLDNYVAKPLSDAYKFITPDFMETGVRNFFNNLQDVGVVMNDVLQAKFGQGAEDLGRLGMNTTLGLMGMFDVATDVGLEKHNEDFGQTLAVWGVPQGSYLVLPFLGPTTIRELPGYVVDSAVNPVTYVPVAMPLAGLGLLNARANAEGALQFVNEAALDPYVFTREAYLQWRNYQSTDGKVDTSKEMDDLEADLLGDEASESKAGSKKMVATNQTQPAKIEAAVPDAPVKSSYSDAKKAFMEADAKLRALQLLHAKK